MMEEALALSAPFDDLTGSDRGFARAMVSATLRQLGRIDAALEPLLDRPFEEAPPFVRALLRLGAAQAWLLETPDHALVGETVAAAKLSTETQRASGFLNAVLRKVAGDHETFAAVPDTALWPEWLLDYALSSLDEVAVEQLLKAQTRQPELHLTPKSDAPEALATSVGGRVIGVGSVALPSQPVEALEGYEAGDWWVQDAAAALPAHLLQAEPGEHIVDLCAAPGGKTMQLAATGARVTAIDRSKPRLKRLKQNLYRTSLRDNVTVVQADASKWPSETPIDRILLDAPCSALGTLRRHPEGVWIKSEDDISRFPQIQARLLAASCEQVKPGGTIVYCVCSPFPAEGEEIVRSVTARGLAEIDPITETELGDFKSSLLPNGDVRTLPSEMFDHDAFYICRLKRPS